MSDEAKDDKIKELSAQNHALSSNNRELSDLLNKAERTPLFGPAYPHHDPIVHHQLIFNTSRKVDFDPISGCLRLWSQTEYTVVCKDELEDFMVFLSNHKDDYPAKRKAEVVMPVTDDTGDTP